LPRVAPVDRFFRAEKRLFVLVAGDFGLVERVLLFALPDFLAADFLPLEWVALLGRIDLTMRLVAGAALRAVFAMGLP
jgi:hypothetical protein